MNIYSRRNIASHFNVHIQTVRSWATYINLPSNRQFFQEDEVACMLKRKQLPLEELPHIDVFANAKDHLAGRVNNIAIPAYDARLYAQTLTEEGILYAEWKFQEYLGEIIKHTERHRQLETTHANELNRLTNKLLQSEKQKTGEAFILSLQTLNKGSLKKSDEIKETIIEAIQDVPLKKQRDHI